MTEIVQEIPKDEKYTKTRFIISVSLFIITLIIGYFIAFRMDEVLKNNPNLEFTLSGFDGVVTFIFIALAFFTLAIIMSILRK